MFFYGSIYCCKRVKTECSRVLLIIRRIQKLVGKKKKGNFVGHREEKGIEK